MSDSSTRPRNSVVVSEYVRGDFAPLSHLAYGWELHTAIPLTPAEERTMVREPAQAVPASIAKRLGAMRVLVVPYIACFETGDRVEFSKPEGETHSAVWLEEEGKIHLVLACRELDAHDTGFELLASVAELLRVRLPGDELQRFANLLDEELRSGAPGEIDEESLAAKRPLLERGRVRHRAAQQFERYRDVAFVSTLAEYIHGLWHDVQIRVGPDHLRVQDLRRRMKLMGEMFPPNPGYQIFSRELEQEADPHAEA